MEERISRIEDYVDEWEDVVREDHKNWKAHEQNMCVLWNIMKHIGREGAELHSSSIENILNQS